MHVNSIMTLLGAIVIVPLVWTLVVNYLGTASVINSLASGFQGSLTAAEGGIPGRSSGS